MTNSTKNRLPKIYNITALIAFIYAALTIVFSVYKQFFYVDRTWFHGFTANGFAILSNLIWMGILIVFKLFLNRILKYNKANSLINASLIFIAIAFFSVASVLLASIKIYMSLDKTGEINSLTSFASTSISGALWLIIANIGMIITTILLGNRIRKIDVVLKNLFTILGFSLIVLGIGSAMQAVSIIDSDMIVLLLKAFMVAVLGYLLKEASQIDYSAVSSLQQLETRAELNASKINFQVKESSPGEPEKAQKINILKKNKEIIQEQEALPIFDINELEDKERILSYFEDLSKDELNRLEVVVAKKYNQNLTDDQIKNLVIHHIADKKLYDHNRYAPK